MKTSLISAALFGLVFLSTGTFSHAVDQYPIAGTTPWQRPAGAPVVEWVNQRERSWYQKGLTGITPPYPPSLYFMDNQGNWNTPFINRGMTPPYDLRGWHQ